MFDLTYEHVFAYDAIPRTHVRETARFSDRSPEFVAPGKYGDNQASRELLTQHPAAYTERSRRRNQMSRLTVIPSRVLIVISTIVVALVLLLASSVQATGELLEITEVQTAEYKVRSGDNLWDIAADHTPDGRDVWTTIESIKRMNDINGSVIQPGQVLEIPLASAS